MTEEKKAPSEFDGPEEVKKETNQLNRAILIRTNEALSTYDIVETFEFEGEQYERQEGLAPTLLNLIAKDAERAQMAAMVSQAVMESLTKDPIDINTPQGPMQTTLIQYMANMTASVIAQHQKQEKENIEIVKNLNFPN